MKYNGILIYNNCLISNKYNDVYNLYIDASKTLNVNLKLISNLDIYSMINTNSKLTFKDNIDIDFIIFLDKDLYLAEVLELNNYRVYNSYESIRLCDNKILTTIALANNNINMPKTIIGPKFYKGYKIDDTNLEYIKYLEQELKYPIVIKQACGSFGKQVYLVNNRKELTNKMQELIGIDCLYQEFINTSFGKDVRIQVAFNEVVASAKRVSKSDFRSNVSNGGTMEKYEPNEEYKKLAISVCKILKLDFAGVDILFGENNIPILCEVNSNALINNLYNCTNINSAYAIISGIIKDLNK